MANVIHLKMTNGSSSNYVKKNVSGAALWVTCDVYFVSQLPPSNGDFSANLMGFSDVSSLGGGDAVVTTKDSGVNKWAAQWTTGGPFGTVTTGVWYHVALFYQPGSPIHSQLTVDGVDFNPPDSAYNITDAINGAYFGAIFPGGWETTYELYIANPMVGTSIGSDNVWGSDLSSGTLGSIFDTVNGPGSGETLDLIADPTGTAPVYDGTPDTGPVDVGMDGPQGGVRVAIAFDDPTLEPTPAWTSLTQYDSFVASYEINRGRQYEFDKTDTGTARVSINDRDGLLDPTNTTGPYFGKIEPLLQIRIDLWNPVTSEYSTRFRGFIEDYDYVVAPFAHQDEAGNTVGVNRLEISCVDIFAILTAIEMQPDGAFGDTPPTSPNDSSGNIFFDNATGLDRATQVLGNAGIDPAFYVIFTLNINCQETVYAPAMSVLDVIQDVADAEFPTVANAYGDRLGRLALHGRLSRFDPAGVAAGAGVDAWDFHEWKAGDGFAVAASPSDTAHIRTFSFNRGWSKIFNYAFCTPKGLQATAGDPTALSDQVSQDAGSIAQFGFRSWSAESLILGALTGDPFTGTADTLTGQNAPDACKTVADYIVANYKSPRNRITNVSFRSIRPTAEGAAANWEFLSKVDISDLVDVYVRGPGDAPGEYIFNGDQFFVEGINETATPLNGEYANVTLTVDLSPRAYFTAGAWSGA